MPIKKHVVIGGFGFIGSNLVRTLSRNAKVLCIDDLSNSISQELIEDINASENVTSLFRDINDEEVWSEIIEWCAKSEVDVWHLAANSDIRASGMSPQIDFKKTFQTSVSVIELCDLLEVKNLIFASTSAVYGEPLNPFVPLSEESPCNPISYYGAAKLASEVFLNVLKNFSNMNHFYFRFANIVGSPATHGLIFDVLNHIKAGKNPIPILGNGDQLKTYIEVNALLSQMFEVLKSGKPGIYNLGPGDSGISVKEIVMQIREHAAPGSTVSFENTEAGWVGDVPKILLDTSKADRVIGSNTNTSWTAIHWAIHHICEQFNMEIRCDNL